MPRTRAIDYFESHAQWPPLPGGSGAFYMAQWAQPLTHTYLLVTEDVLSAKQWAAELSAFHPDPDRVHHLPGWETLPYDCFSPPEYLISTRLHQLYQLPLQPMIWVTDIATALHYFPDPAHVAGQSFVLSVGDPLDFDRFAHRLVAQGYVRVSKVFAHGEFAQRGAVMDVFPMGAKVPYRIERNDDVIESLRAFDIKTQRSLRATDSIRLLPAHEFPLDEEAIARFRAQWRARFDGNPATCPLYQSISKGQTAPGIAYYQTLFFDEPATLFDYLPAETTLLLGPNLTDAAQACLDQYAARYEQLRYDRHRPILSPNEILLPVDQWFQKAKAFAKKHLDKPQAAPMDVASPLPCLQSNPRADVPFQALATFLESYRGQVIFCAETAGRRTVVLDWLSTVGCFPLAQPDCQAALAAQSPYHIIDAPIERGFLLTDPPLALITESDLIEQKNSVVTRQKAKQGNFVDPADVLHSLTELQVGDYLVHRDHGVGRYAGLVALETNGTLGDYLMLDYADEDKLYLPIAALHLVTRYRTQHTSEQTQRRDKLGNTRWQQAKQKAQKRIYDVAAELLAAAQARAQATGFQCQLPDADTQRFRDAFPFQETPDQRTAIDAVMADLSSSQPMDRLVCGDVGFGKTEVAIQAAFLTVQSGGQVAVLVPTTLLVRQHYERFCQRFADWPVVIAPLSRLQTAAEIKQTQARLAEGKIDIVIGTHALLSNKVSFKHLGLLIIDEEQRFGVRQKEKIKALKANLNVMTLSATPIPRTLNLSLAGMRSLSMITTPPQHRLPIHTFVGSGDSQLIREAVSREVQRGGQVYYLYNDVKKMPLKLAELTEMMPRVSIQMAHGQMSPDELEKTMLDFHRQRFSVLLCSTIIESGIDMPNANTLIIDRADQFGLAQLHQIRGRVGRSHHQAYAYCLIPRDVKLRKTAERRLEALKSLDSLGSGLMLATHDLEIRGAGEVLGESQSGQMNTLGVPLFMQLLEEAVDAASGKVRELKPSDIEVDLGVSALIPPEYIADIPVRLALYQKLNHITDPAALGDLKADCIDQFGPLPEPLIALFYTAQLRCLAQRVGIQAIQCLRTSATMTLAPQHQIAIDQVIQLIQQQPTQYQLRGENTLRIQLSVTSSQDRFNFLSECIHGLIAN